MLTRHYSDREAASHFDMEESQINALVDEALQKLWNYRSSSRPKPHRDDKVTRKKRFVLILYHLTMQLSRYWLHGTVKRNRNIRTGKETLSVSFRIDDLWPGYCVSHAAFGGCVGLGAESRTFHTQGIIQRRHKHAATQLPGRSWQNRRICRWL